MGVVYKLRQEVIDFIIAQKKDNPRISCRQLAKNVEDSYQVKVSKSSVNSVLKEANLSSSVGRRTVVDQGKKFEIPEERKKQIFSTINPKIIEKFESPAPKKKPNLEEELGKLLASENNQEIPLPDIKKSKETSEEIKKEDSKKPTAGEKKDEQINQNLSTGSQQNNIIKEKIEDTENPFIDQEARDEIEAYKKERSSKQQQYPFMGIVFFKAIEWFLESPRFWGNLFARAFPGKTPENVDEICQKYILAKILLKTANVKPEDLNNYWIRGEEIPAINKGVAELPFNSSLGIHYENDARQLFTFVYAYRIVLADDTEIVLDASQFALNKVSTKGESLSKAMRVLSESLISNRRGNVFYQIPGEKEIDEEFYHLVAALEDVDEKAIVSINVLGENNREIANFSIIPRKRRSYAFGMSPRLKEFSELIKNTKWAERKHFFHKMTRKSYYYTETASRYLYQQMETFLKIKMPPEAVMRILTLWEMRGGDPVGIILTGLQDAAAKEVINEYLDTFKNINENNLVRNNGNNGKNSCF
ncbi:MAG: helix-turn-helix domain-containing protein, partial [Candidatus Omnitrophica bacterium]|nr:helix-turn-helix domain-containing protein [Candidatus Omnitrophota bacterium]